MPVVQGEVTGGGSVKMIVDGLVFSIAQAISRQPDENELIDAVLREFEPSVIYEAWKQYFIVFNGVISKRERNLLLILLEQRFVSVLVTL